MYVAVVVVIVVVVVVVVVGGGELEDKSFQPGKSNRIRHCSGKSAEGPNLFPTYPWYMPFILKKDNNNNNDNDNKDNKMCSSPKIKCALTYK